MILKNCIIFKDDEFIKVDIRTKDDLIVEISKEINKENEEIIDIKNRFVSPGFIDMHTHLRDPGYTHKETIKSASMAGVAGGYTLLCAMPNTKPVMDNEKIIDEFYEEVKKNSYLNIMTFGAITTNFENKLVDFNKLNNKVCGFSNDGMGVQNANIMYEAMLEVSKHDGLISAHCEENSLLYEGYVHDSKINKDRGYKGINSISESVQLSRDILLSEATNCNYHVCHVSTKESVRLLKYAKQDNLKVTSEVTVHHLLLCDEDVKTTNEKMNPPLRTIEDQKALINGLLDGTIDVIATDHAPHTYEEKMQSMKDAPMGVVGLETAFSLIYTNFIKNNRASMSSLINWFSTNPSKILKINDLYGSIEVGKKASICVIDLDKKYVIDSTKFYSKQQNTPFNNVECYGKIEMNIIDGKVVYDLERGGFNE